MEKWSEGTSDVLALDKSHTSTLHIPMTTTQCPSDFFIRKMAFLSLFKYFSSTNYMPGTILSIKCLLLKKTDKNLIPSKWNFFKNFFLIVTFFFSPSKLCSRCWA